MQLIPIQNNKYEGWQYNGQPKSEWPNWVKKCCELNSNNELFHIRQSGKQLLNLTEWLVKDLDGVIIYYTNDELRRKFKCPH